ncbi:hypothetical protein, partial [Klebsiella aerogenes]|uniref:hypothetical protein n=1 Tax=Klebsiella aerogenes TaxID=548 RepID=UPI001CC5760D
FQFHYASLYDGMRLCYRRILDSEAPVVSRVEEQLNEGVVKSLEVELTGLQRIKDEADVRRRRVKYLQDLGQDWTFKERTRWVPEVPVLPSWKP